MSAEHPHDTSDLRGPIAWMARNSVAANLLMFVVLVGGAIGLSRMKQEVFPEFDLDLLTVSVPYPGASPAEVEQGIVLAVEEAVRGIDGVKRVTSVAAEGVGNVTMELLLEADPDKVLADAKSAVDRILTFPEEAEEPAISLASSRQEVINLVIAGDQDLSSLHALAEQARRRLLESPDITQVEIEGLPPLEVSIEVPREQLESFGLSLDDVARQIAAASLELPGGSIDTETGELLVRVADRKYSADDFSKVILRSTTDGSDLQLGDIASITDGYADTDQATYFNGKPAVRVTAYRVGDETPIDVANAVRAYSDELRAELPDTVPVEVWDGSSEILKGRIGLLVRNARLGLILVVLILALLLDLRLAFWVSLGIPISFLGSFLLMPGLDMSVNMITLFALIITLGMVVDDAIVVGENAFEKMERGLPRLRASIEGAREMAVPVTFAILTTLATFSPLMFVPGTMGKIFRLMPTVVGAVLVLSLFESFFVLPAHLAHSGSKRGDRPSIWDRAIDFINRPRGRIMVALGHFTERTYKPVLAAAVRERYVVLAGASALLVITVGLVASGKVPFSFFPNIEGNTITVAVRLPYGSPLAHTLRIKDTLEASAMAAVDEVGRDTYVGMITEVGQGPQTGFGEREAGGHLLTIELGLVASEEREFTAEEFGAVWAEKSPPLAGVEAVVFESNFGPHAGAAVDVQLTHSDMEVLAEASAELAEVLRSYEDLTAVDNAYAAGKPQFDARLLPDARSLGLNAVDLARQMRSAFYGAEALREQRGRNELKVMVRLPEEQRRSEEDLMALQIRSPSGALVPMSQVATFERSRAPTSIRREEGRRIVNVQAKLAPGVKSSREVLDAFQTTDLPSLLEKHPGLAADMVGEQREQGEAFASLGTNFLFALFIVYALLAIPFKSYTQPLIIMSAIPFGFVGAIAGHVLMGYNLSIISMFGIVALAGVVVNDSLVLIDSANRAERAGAEPLDAILFAGQRRLRPILLTSFTTFFGLMPMIFETSIQARFLIPMAISLGYGVLFATVIILILVPSLYMIRYDLVSLAARARNAVGDLVHGQLDRGRPEDAQRPHPGTIHEPGMTREAT
jgi:multidrug efflux pump subunit AcrB